MKGLREMGVAELQQLWERKRDELVEIKMELDRRKGDVPAAVDVNFEDYVQEWHDSCS